MDDKHTFLNHAEEQVKLGVKWDDYNLAGNAQLAKRCGQGRTGQGRAVQGGTPEADATTLDSHIRILRSCCVQSVST